MIASAYNYVSIDHMLLLDRLAGVIPDRNILNLVWQYLRRTAERGGCFWDYERGISLGCPLSPLIGAFFLDELDRRMAASGLFYVRFMDDILVLAPTRWKLRRAVAVVNHILGALRLEKHPEKTFIGRIARGFDFLPPRCFVWVVTTAPCLSQPRRPVGSVSWFG